MSAPAAIFRWTDELVDDMRRRATAGETATEIAKAIGAPSRNAILGKAFRLGIPLGATAQAGKAKPLPTAKPRPAATARPKPEPASAPLPLPAELRLPPKAFCEPVEEPTGRVALFDLKVTSCRWPLGDPRHPDFGFCGKFQRFGATYCAEHAALAYTSREAQLVVERA